MVGLLGYSGSPICIVHADNMIVTRSKVKVTR